MMFRVLEISNNIAVSNHSDGFPTLNSTLIDALVQSRPTFCLSNHYLVQNTLLLDFWMLNSDCLTNNENHFIVLESLFISVLVFEVLEKRQKLVLLDRAAPHNSQKSNGDSRK
jgi:hypothetical protein